jgi:hypothetical protein
MNSAETTACAASLEDLIEAATDRLRSGRPVDPDDLAAGRPDLAAELRELLPALQVLAGLSASAGGPTESCSPLGGTLRDFRILREVGRGGMGVVYEAEQISLNRRVALKVLPFAATMDPRHLQRFKNEAMAAAQLHHPHIVPVHAVGSERGVHYFAMQFIDGQPLSALIGRLQKDSGKGSAPAPAAPARNGPRLTHRRTARRRQRSHRPGNRR